MKTILRSISRSHLRCGFFMLAVALCCFALSPALKAGCPNPPGVCFGQNTAVGADALFNVTSGVWNVGVGVDALFNTTVGNQNTGIGYQTLFNNIDGSHHTGIGSQALFNNTTGNDNVGVGFRTLYSNTSGNRNTGMGYRTLAFSDTGDDNTAVGWNALYNNRSGAGFNTAVGSQALRGNLSSELNVAVGDSALGSFNGTTFTDGANTALGSIALSALTSGQENVVAGRRALEFLTAGSNNVAMGWRSGDGLTTGSFNTFIGDQAGLNEGPDVSNVICLGILGDTNGGQATPNRCYIGNIHGVNMGGPGPYLTVMIDGDGQLGTAISSRRFKKDIEPMNQASEGVLKLKPVTFHYKNRDNKNDLTPQFGLIAEEVEQVNRDLVAYGKDGKPLSVRYDAVNVMLLNEFLKEHKKVEEQQASIADLKSNVALQQKEMQVLTAQLKEQAAQIQKVSAQLEVSKPAPRTVSTNP
jgi:trimeric autotransporter adhesin